ncbi:SIMPL domain-containing protein [Galbibacter mesophilus]|uniref:SIMPL domain-containing protein n=1 Tax=Galbibacter mesophilus TaxID=379069 RepID=UPI00191CC1B6|nr:SIMPL domain-containing protein [Galbibacter mesophilus]MCM5663247.1 SIMPL domain-containing protein [Galbibacter mesophilus]
MRKILFLVLAVVCVTSVQAQETNPSISVVGEGTVKVVPDQVLIKVRVESEGKSAEAVKKENDLAIDKVIKYAKSMKISEKDIHTEYVNLNKNYDYQTKQYKYVANQSMSILLKDLNKYAQFTEGLLNAGINRIDGVTFKSTEIDNHNSQARMAAVKNAKMKASEYASVLNQKVGKAISISEMGSITPPQPIYRMEMMKASDSMEQGEDMETIAIGEMVIKAKVNVTFELE